MGFSPCASWNFLVASIVESSHFPFGLPAKEPSLASACWISEMRSGVGVFCPRSLRLDFLKVLFPCVAELAFEQLPFFFGVLCACAEFANTPSPAARSSVEARQVAFRSRINISVDSTQSLLPLLLLTVGWNFARQIQREDPVAVLPAKHLEDHILATLQF